MIRDEVVITATRTPVALMDSLASATVVTRDQIDARQPVELSDVLRQLPSMELSRNGGPGATSSLFTRGTSGGHTLILVDGMRLSSATSGGTSVQFLNPDQIERIEVVRGAYSSLYGSEAIGGVVQIFTRDGSASPGSYVSAATGSHHLRKTAIGTSGSQGRLRYGVHASYLDTDGINNQEADPHRDRDGYRNRSLNASVGYAFDNGADLSLRFLESNNRNEYDNIFEASQLPYGDTWLQNISLKGTLPVTGFWVSHLALGLSTDDSDNYDKASGNNLGHFRTRRQQFQWQNDFILADSHVLTLGYDYYEDEVQSGNAYVDGRGRSVKTRDNEALFAQYQGSWSIVDLVLGVREEDNEYFGNHTTGNVSLGFHLDDNHRLVATWAEGFKAPTFNDLYWPSTPGSGGNPDLRPEVSENIEVSLRGDYQRWHWALGYFDNDVDNLIAWAPGSDLVWRPYNVAEAEIEGAELILGATLLGWDLTASYTYLEPKDADRGNLLPRRSRNNLALNAETRIGDRLSVGLSLKTQGKRYDDAANSQKLDGYTTLGLRVGLQLSRTLAASLRGDNLLDRGYQLAGGYLQEGRTWLLGLTWRP